MRISDWSSDVCSSDLMPRAEVLSLEEIDRIASAFVRRGVRRLRLTGGEPLVRRGIEVLVDKLGRHLRTGALDELTLTTNGSQPDRHAVALAAAGGTRSEERRGGKEGVSTGRARGAP